MIKRPVFPSSQRLNGRTFLQHFVAQTQALALIAQGEEQRHVGATELNAESSRSHTIFRLLIESRPVYVRAPCVGWGNGGMRLVLTIFITLSPTRPRFAPPTHPHREGVGPLRSSILSLIDLAGSENAKLTNATGGRQREGAWSSIEGLQEVVGDGLTNDHPPDPFLSCFSIQATTSTRASSPWGTSSRSYPRPARAAGAAARAPRTCPSGARADSNWSRTGRAPAAASVKLTLPPILPFPTETPN